MLKGMIVVSRKQKSILLAGSSPQGVCLGIYICLKLLGFKNALLLFQTWMFTVYIMYMYDAVIYT